MANNRYVTFTKYTEATEYNKPFGNGYIILPDRHPLISMSVDEINETYESKNLLCPDGVTYSGKVINVLVYQHGDRFDRFKNCHCIGFTTFYCRREYSEFEVRLETKRFLRKIMSLFPEFIDNSHIHERNNIIKESWAVNAKIIPAVKSRYNLDSLAKSEWSEKFESLMRNRLIMGALRYGLIHKPNKRKYNRIDAIRKRLNSYEETGNDEFLVDIANFCLLEFEEGIHPNKHFKSIDDGEHVEPL